MSTRENFTVKDLVTLLLDRPMDEEVLVEETDGDLFCMISSTNTECIESAETISDDKVLSFTDMKRRRQDYYNKYYGSTAFKYEHRRWTKWEDELIMQYPEGNDLELSKEMERSVAAIQTRRWNLRKRKGLVAEGCGGRKARARKGQS